MAEQAEGYIKQQSANQRPSNTQTNLENRASKRKRIEEAKRNTN